MAVLAKRHGLAAAIALGGVVVVAVDAWALRHAFVGDAAVYLPYARNVGDGHLFQFNVGQFSSGSTSPLWSVLLGVPYAFGAGIGGARAVSALFAAIGFLATIAAAARVSRSWLAGAVAAILVLGTATFYAVSLYESGLIITLSALAILAGGRVHERLSDEQRATGDLVRLGLVWSALPLARPESVILVAAEFLALAAFAADRRRAVMRLAATLAAAAVPAVLYFGWSVADLGTFSTSSQGRTHALKEAGEHWFGPFYRSGDAIRELFSRPWIFVLVPAAAGVVLLARQRASAARAFAAYAVLAVLGYLALLTFLAPGFYDTPRYLLPIVPVLCAAAASLLARARPHRWWPVAVVVGLAVVATASALDLRDITRFARHGQITETEVFSRDVVGRLNAIAPRGDTVLSYEVQLRYFLRPDLRVLSEDGITDGKVAPYQDHPADLTGFLRRYRPQWWIVDRNAHVRPFMRGSVLDGARTAMLAGMDRVTLDGIRFTVIARRPRPQPRAFGGWEILARLGY